MVGVGVVLVTVVRDVVVVVGLLVEVVIVVLLVVEVWFVVGGLSVVPFHMGNCVDW